ncbi:MAG: DNA polymerase IV [Pseudomonadales bacterium]
MDMDCFYAAVEMRDDPSLKGHPLAVGGAADRRGVVSTCNYEAREFGIHSAMATAYALRLCPQLKVLPVRMSYYAEVSRQLRTIFRRYTDIIEPLSLDEAFLDVSSVKMLGGSATLIAQDIRRAIRRELDLTASAGVAPNKFLAKICSDENKPDGQCVVTPDKIDEFVVQLPLKKIPGVGKVTVNKLAKHGLHTCADVREMGETELYRRFGNLGKLLYKRAWGIDDRPLTTQWIRKSLSVERTFATDIPDFNAATESLDKLFEELTVRLEKNGARPIKNQQVKLKFSDFKVTTMERASGSLDKSLFEELIPLAWERGVGKSIRLLGIGVTFRDDEAHLDTPQLKLFLDSLP